MEDIGKKLRAIRIVKGYTQARLAEESEVSLRTIKSIEAGNWDGRISILQKLSNSLDCDLEIEIIHKF